MRCHLVIPHAIWPNQSEAAEVTVGLLPPALSLLVGRGVRESFVPISFQDWLGQAFGLSDFPAGPLTLASERPDEPAGYWLRADPVHLAINQRGAEMADPRSLAVSPDEAEQLVAALNKQFAGDDLHFLAATPDRWLLQLHELPNAIFSPLESVYGRSVGEFLPQGADAARWHRRLNEIQMLLYAHPVNDIRAALGQPLINSLWLWGGGIHPLRCSLRKPAELVFSNDSMVATLAKLAGARRAPRPDSFGGITGTDVLVLLDDLILPALWRDAIVWREAWEMLETSWLAPARELLADGRLSELLITMPEAGLKITVHKHDLWRVWRRPRLPWQTQFL